MASAASCHASSVMSGFTSHTKGAPRVSKRSMPLCSSNLNTYFSGTNAPRFAGGRPLVASTRPSGASRVHFWREKSQVVCSASLDGVTTAAVTVEGGVATVKEEKAAAEEELFDWDKAWYPVVLTKTLDKRIPEPVTILGRPLVIWFDQVSDQWRIFHDLCPHRLAPLSEGRIHESGQLQCSYHGWTFSGEGSCGFIPQAPKDGPAVNASPRACARVYPCREHQGILWFWPDCSPSAAAESSAAPPPPTLAEFDDPSYRYDTGMADLEYGYEMLMENLLDPAHVPFAHHKYQGDRNKGGPMPKMVVTSIAARGIDGTSFLGGPAAVVPPCTLIQKLFIGGKVEEGSGKKQKTAILFFHCIPRLPGQSRLIWFFMNNIIPPWVPSPPEWFVHFTRMKVLDTDHVLLHLTERRLEEEGGEVKGVRQYYTPTAADSFVSAYRSWLQKYAGSKARFPAYVNPALPPAKSRREILDRQRFHVRLCPDCQRVQRWSERLGTALWAAALLLLAATALLPLAPPAVQQAAGPTGAVVAAVAALVCAAAAHWLKGFIERNYVFEDFVHALWYPATK